MSTPSDDASTWQSDSYYASAREPELVECGPVAVLAIEGRGEPGGPRHLEAISALLAVAAELGRVAGERGTSVSRAPLEGLWWVEDERPWLEVPREEWQWRLLVRVPEAVTEAWVARARAAASAPGAERVELDRLDEGVCLQALHVGPYAREPETIASMDAEMQRQGLTMNGRHHEIYLTDISGPPEQARTILRHPVRRVLTA
jgi:hypothetical protein